MARQDEFDVCVIGTGAGGGVMIQELTAAGFRVVALQRGPFLQTSQFDDDELRTVWNEGVSCNHTLYGNSDVCRTGDLTIRCSGLLDGE